MSDRKSSRVDPAVHRKIEILLPWYANGTLSASELARVEAHLAECPECRREADSCCELARALGEADAAAPSPHPIGLRRLLARIEAEEERRLAHRFRAGYDRLRSLFTATPGLVRQVMAVQLLALAGLSAALMSLGTPGPEVGAPPPEPHLYRTLSDPPPAAADAAATPALILRVVFAEDLTEGEMRRLLLALHAEITGGPSPLGAYTLRIPEDRATDPPSVILAHLRSQSSVRFAEKVAAAPEETLPEPGRQPR